MTSYSYLPSSEFGILNELSNQLAILFAGGTFNAAGDVDGKRPYLAHCTADIMGIKPTGEHHT
jgi:hypothetical protein